MTPDVQAQILDAWGWDAAQVVCAEAGPPVVAQILALEAELAPLYL